MIRASRWCLLMLIGCLVLWTGGAYAAEGAAGAAQPEASAPAASQELPSIQIPEATFDFGEITEGGEVAHEFVVKNAGQAMLQIDQVRPG